MKKKKNNPIPKKTVYSKIFGKERLLLSSDHPMYCCPTFQEYFMDRIDTPIAYAAQQRVYYWITPKHEATVDMVRLRKCPLCGKKFPKDLWKEFFRELSKVVGHKITYTYTEYDWNTLPEEFKTDEWWQKRGL